VTATVAALLARAVVALAGDEPRREAELLAQHAFARSRAWLFAHGDAPVEADAAERLRVLVGRRVAGEPLAYIVGRREFFSLDLEITSDVLIPRPETELLVEQALMRIPTGADAAVADLGTGSGAIALAIASMRPASRVVATDASPAALAVARANAQRLGIGNVEFALGDWCAALPPRRFDVVVSNPPYIAAGDRHLREGDLRFEPVAALASGSDGLDAIRAIVAAAPTCLARGGWLLFEHGYDQGAAVQRLLEKRGFTDISTSVDIENRERVSAGRAAA